MANFCKFNFKDGKELKEKIYQLRLDIPWDNDLRVLGEERQINDKKIPNSLAIHPMEGCDGDQEGRPTELTRSRYKEFVAGGAGLIWWEATSIVPEGRSNPNQLQINEGTKDSLEKLVTEVNELGEKKNGYRPCHILQLNHSGRYSAPEGKKRPLFIFHDPYLDEKAGISREDQPVSDQYLDSLVPAYIKAARLAYEAGFDGVDIKICHRYLLSEVVAGYTREGEFGGDFSNRLRLIEDIVEGIKNEVGDKLLLTARLNLYDSIPYPYGFGVDREDERKADLREPVQLVKILADKGVEIFSISASDPRYKPYIVRPFNRNLNNITPPEHPLEGVARHFKLTAAVQKTLKDKVVLGAGYSWLRHLFPYIAAGNINNKRARMAGVGRTAFAYPGFANDILKRGQLKEDKSCIACSKCTELMIAGGPTGCVIHSRDPYFKLYRQRVKAR